jgi:hypothetical protein
MECVTTVGIIIFGLGLVGTLFLVKKTGDGLEKVGE